MGSPKFVRLLKETSSPDDHVNHAVSDASRVHQDPAQQFNLGPYVLRTAFDGSNDATNVADTMHDPDVSHVDVNHSLIQLTADHLGRRNVGGICHCRSVP